MKKILISYGDDAFKQSLHRLKQEAQKLNIFDKIILYNNSDLPVYILSSPLMTFTNGGGYWIWKPYLIWKTLQDFKNDAIVFYVDAGCTLNKSSQWNYYFQKMLEYDTILFKYKKSYNYGWGQLFNCESTSIKHWTKKNTLEYFDKLFKSSDWQEYDKIMGGFIIAKNKTNVLINEWLKTSIFHPELIIEPFGNEVNDQHNFFSIHRHDQSIITPLAYFYASNKDVLILDESAKSGLIEDNNDIAVLATRKRDIKKQNISIKTKLIKLIKVLISERVYNILHGR